MKRSVRRTGLRISRQRKVFDYVSLTRGSFHSVDVELCVTLGKVGAAPVESSQDPL